MKKLSYALVGFVLLAFLFSFTVNTPLLAQEKEEEVEDVMDMALEDLLNVEITTAGKKAEKISDIPASVVVITRADIERYGYHTLNDVLENVPGLFFIDQRDVAGPILGVRGFWAAFANNIIYLINGVRQERMTSDGAAYTSQYIPVEAIDRIEVIRGPMSVIYGPGAFFGAINIITNDAKNSSQIALSYGLEQTMRVATRAAYQKDDLSFVVNAGYYDTDGPDIPHSKMSTMDLSELTQYTSTDGLWGIENKFFNFSGAYKGFYANFTFNQDDRQSYLLFLPTSDDGTVSHVTYTSISFGYKHDFSEKFSLDGKFTYHRGTTRGEFGWFVPPGYLNIGGDFNDREDYEVDITAFFNPSKKINITGGLYYKKLLSEQLEGVYPIFELYYRLGLNEPSENRAVFVQGDFAPSKKIRLVVGLRLEQALEYSVSYRDLSPGDIVGDNAVFEQGDVEFIPRVALLYYLNEKNIVKFLYGKAINNPSFYHTVAQVTSGQPQLSPEFITTFELNYLAAFSEKFTFNASIFYNKFDNLIVNTPFIDDEGNWVAGFNTNSGKMKTIGAEVTIQAKPSKKFMLELSGTYQKTDDERPDFKEFDVAYSPKMLGYLKAAYNFNKKSSLAVTGRYVGEMEALYDLTLGDRIANKTDGYFVLGANLRFDDLFGKGYFLNISASNLFDTEYHFPSFTLNSAWADIGLMGYGRMVMVSFGKKF